MKMLTKEPCLKASLISLLLISAYSYADYDCSNNYQWTSTGVFFAGDKVRFSGHAYSAMWWSQGERPDLNSSGFGVWKDLGACRPAAKVSCDFNNDGLIDTAEGFPLADMAGGQTYVNNEKYFRELEDLVDTGEVAITYGNNSTNASLASIWNLNNLGVTAHAKPKTNFGATLAVGDFNNDDFCDLAIGAPGFGDSPALTERGAGVVNILYGSPAGLTINVMDDNGKLLNPYEAQRLDQRAASLGQEPEAGDHFGAALAAGDFNGDGYDDLAIGVPDEGVILVPQLGEVKKAGYFHVVAGSRHGLQTDGIKPVGYFQHIGGVPLSITEANDQYGATIVAADFDRDGHIDLVVAAPGEDDKKGMITVFKGSTQTIINTQQKLDITRNMLAAGSAVSGDEFGKTMRIEDFNSDTFPDLVIDLRSASGAGSVFYIPGSATGLKVSAAVQKKW